MRIILNGKETDVSDTAAFALRDRILPGGYVVIDGFSASEDVPLREGMQVFVFEKDSVPGKEEYEAMMSARNMPGLYTRFRDAKVGIAGLGGLGSNIAIMLTRLGIGHFVIADFDTVDITNLNRQNYDRDDIGKRKTEATARHMRLINPYVDVECFDGKLDEGNVCGVFRNCGIVVEAFDGASQKVMLVNTVLGNTDKWVVSGNGMAGIGPSNTIVTSRPMNRLVMCGDDTSEIGPGMGLSASRVMVAASHQANAVARILAGLDPVG